MFYTLIKHSVLIMAKERESGNEKGLKWRERMYVWGRERYDYECENYCGSNIKQKLYFSFKDRCTTQP